MACTTDAGRQRPERNADLRDLADEQEAIFLAPQTVALSIAGQNKSAHLLCMSTEVGFLWPSQLG